MRTLLRHIIEIIIPAFVLTACHPLEQYEADNRGDFEALWEAVDRHYCFFDEKEVDWQEVHDRYSPMITDKLTRRQLFAICGNMLGELRDGHVNLSSGFETSYYRRWWSDYPQNFNLRNIEQNYLKFDYKQLGNVIYGILPENIAYIHIPSFSSGLADSNIDWIIADIITCNGLILDIRDNGGGNMTYAENWAQHFITEGTTVGYMVHKTGPGHDDFSSPYPIRFSTLAESGGLIWTKPVVLITNRSTYSAANYLTMCLKNLKHVTHVGATTGGGAGMPLSLELPSGWGVRMSAVKVLDSNMESTDSGIKPAENCEIDLDPTLEAQGRDSMIDFAINILK